MKSRKREKLQPPEVFGNLGTGIKKIPSPPPPPKGRLHGILRKLKIENVD
jgi:hypothetical protein